MKKPVRTFKTLSKKESTKASYENSPKGEVKAVVKKMLKKEDFKQTDVELLAERKKKDAQEYNDRMDRLSTAKKAENKDVIGDKNWRENLADKTVATGDKLRVSNKHNFFDDVINPGVWVGDMASTIGQSPKEAKESNSIMPYVRSIGTPLIAGSIAGLSSKTGGSKLSQTVSHTNELFNPLAGTGSVVKNVANKVSKMAKVNKDYLTKVYSKEYAEGYMKQAGNKLAPEVQKAYDIKKLYVKDAADKIRLSVKAEKNEAIRMNDLRLENENYVKDQIRENKKYTDPRIVHSFTKDDIKSSVTNKIDGIPDHKYYEQEAKKSLEESKYALNKIVNSEYRRPGYLSKDDGWKQGDKLPQSQSQIEQEERMFVKITHPSKRSRADQVESERVTAKLKQLAEDNSRKGPSRYGYGGYTTTNDGDAYITKSYSTNKKK